MPAVTEDSNVVLKAPVAPGTAFAAIKREGVFGWDETAQTFTVCPADGSNYVLLGLHPDSAPLASSLNNTDTVLISVGGVLKRTTVQAIGGGGTWQPLDADLTAIAALTTQAFGRSLLTQADAVSVRTLIGAPSTSDLSGYQPLDSDLTAIAALTTTAFGRSLLTQADAAAVRTLIGAGTSSFNGAYTSLSAIPAAIDALDALTPAADRLPYFTGASAASLATFTAFARTLLDDADAATARTTLGAGTVSSVGLSMPSGFTVGSSPVTGSGTLAVTMATQTAGKVFASPGGASGTPSFIALTASHIPNLDWAKITTGLPTTLAGYGIADAQPLDADLTAIAGLSTTAFGRSLLTQADAAAVRALIGAGTVSFVDLSAPNIFTISGNPVTRSGTLALSLVSQSAGKVFASPGGASGTPSFIALTASHIPNLDWAKITTGLPTTLAGYGINNGIAKSMATGTVDVDANKWYRVASSVVGVGRNSREFNVTWTTNGNHGSCRFNATCHYNNPNSVAIQQLEFGKSGGGFSRARIVYRSGTYTGEYCYLELMFDSHVDALAITQEAQEGLGWTLDPVNGTEREVPANYTTYEHTFVALSGVSPGTYAKVTVNKEGRVTKGTSLVVADLPNHAAEHEFDGSDPLAGQSIAGLRTTDSPEFLRVYIGNDLRMKDTTTGIQAWGLTSSSSGLELAARNSDWSAIDWPLTIQHQAGGVIRLGGTTSRPVNLTYSLQLGGVDTITATREGRFTGLRLTNLSSGQIPVSSDANGQITASGLTDDGTFLGISRTIRAWNSLARSGNTWTDLQWTQEAQERVSIFSSNGSGVGAYHTITLVPADTEVAGRGLGAVQWGQKVSGKSGVNAGLKATILADSVGTGGSVGGFGGKLRIRYRPDNGNDLTDALRVGAFGGVTADAVETAILLRTLAGAKVAGDFVLDSTPSAGGTAGEILQRDSNGRVSRATPNVFYLSAYYPESIGTSTVDVTKHRASTHSGSWTLDDMSKKFHKQTGTGTLSLPTASATYEGREYKITFHGRFNFTIAVATGYIYSLAAGQSYWYNVATTTVSAGDASGDNCSCDVWCDGSNWYVRW